ncbi:MAG: cadherin-like beta sandwich domain-containing protein [Clostridia bacterium]|nr:cadherin-like beta sandwich domain-containing protein [Clostridia bacterium]
MKKIISLLLMLVLVFSLINLQVHAKTYSDKATITISKKNATVGNEITVTIRHTSTYPMVTIQGSLQYNSSVLQFVSGDGGNTSNVGSTVKIVKDSSPTNSISTTVKFKAIAAGSGSLSYSAKSFSDVDDGAASAGASVTVTEVKPSTNNNLGSLKLSDGVLTPEFKAATVNYTASVKNPVDKITISANAAVGDSTVAGVGTFELKVGDNVRTVTVTAASGDKKTYTVTIKRMTEEETAEAEKAEREANPYLFVDNGADRFVVPDLTNMTVFEGFAIASLEHKGAQLSYLSDKSGKYNLFWATDKDGANGTFYNRTADGEYEKINYIKTEKRIYIIEPFEDGISVNGQYKKSKQKINGENVVCYKYTDEKLADFCVFKCYINGSSDYYTYDAYQNTVQRAPNFLADKETMAEESGSILDKFNRLNIQAKILLLLLTLAGLLVFLLIILLIVKAAKGNKSDIEEDMPDDIDSVADGYGYEISSAAEPEEDVPDEPLQNDIAGETAEEEPAEGVAPEKAPEEINEAEPADEPIEAEPYENEIELGDATDVEPAEDSGEQFDTSEFIDIEEEE